jgi:hypothetical protein
LFSFIDHSFLDITSIHHPSNVAWVCVGGWCGGKNKFRLDSLFDLSDLDPFAIPLF